MGAIKQIDQTGLDAQQNHLDLWRQHVAWCEGTARPARNKFGSNQAMRKAMSQGHIRQQGKGSWEIKFELDRDPVTGNRVTRYVTIRSTRKEARAELTRLPQRQERGDLYRSDQDDGCGILRPWLNVYVGRQLAAKTAARHRQIVDNNIKPRLGHVSLRKLTKVHIEAFEAELQREGYLKGRKRGSGLTAQTVLHVHRTLSQAVQHAVDSEVLIKNPAEKVEPPRPSGKERSRS